MDQKIRTLGLYQPFATLMLHGKIETRLVSSYFCPERNKVIDKKPPFPLGKYVIYSTQKFYRIWQSVAIMGRFSKHAFDTIKGDPTEHLKGYAIAIGDLVKIIDPIEPQQSTFVDLQPYEYDIHNYPTARRVGLVFENMRRIKPFKFKGKQGIGFLSKEDEEKIKFI